MDGNGFERVGLSNDRNSISSRENVGRQYQSDGRLNSNLTRTNECKIIQTCWVSPFFAWWILIHPCFVGESPNWDKFDVPITHVVEMCLGDDGKDQNCRPNGPTKRSISVVNQQFTGTDEFDPCFFCWNPLQSRFWLSEIYWEVKRSPWLRIAISGGQCPPFLDAVIACCCWL